MTCPSDTDQDLQPTPPARRWMFKIVRYAAVPAIAIALLWITGCMERMFYIPTAEPTPLSAAPAGAESVWFAPSDGTRLHGWFIPARGTQPRDAATILHVHGNAGNVMYHTFFTEHLPPANFNVFIFDYRGYGQSEGRAVRRNPLIADTHAALDALLARDDVDPQRIGMYAQSLGAAIGINVMAERQEIKAAVLESPFASWRDIAAAALGGDPPHVIARALAAVLIPDHARPVDAIAKVQRPILILHGDADTITPVSHARQMAAAAPQHVELIELPDGDHNTLRSTHAIVDRHMIDFFQAHLAAPQ